MTPEQNEVTIVGSDTVSDLRKRIEELEAGSAVMRETMEELFVTSKELIQDWRKGDFDLCALAECDARSLEAKLPRTSKVLLSTTAGADFLSRYKAMEVELADCKNSLHSLEHGKYGRNDYAQRLIESDGRLLPAHTALKSAVEAMVSCSERLSEVSKCCFELRDWDTIGGDWINAALNQTTDALTLAKACGVTGGDK